ncbi:response regulator [Nitrincola iocasae]|uniref:Response regulator transcription factor n=1 Tax=Nitrincola iocasae TaxID=2614693 RepID=A0A5J6LH17_9GAMM|nr:response regulator transcription factor [Nitrincola iocasae]QEW07909.1 response regulator transcription factor [Nitrincola iocasae]
MRILLVEDTQGLGEAIRDQLQDEGYAVDWVMCIEAAASCLRSTDYDLLLLDLMLPDGSGLSFLQQLRKTSSFLPVIIMTAKDQIADRINGLNAGADDYLVKPFNLDEMMARVAAVARRYSGNPNPNIVLGDLQVNLADKTVYHSERSVELTSREWAIFETFLQHPGQLLTRSRLEDALYAFGAEIESNTIEVYISRLRKKLGKGHIETVRGMGYRMPRG